MLLMREYILCNHHTCPYLQVIIHLYFIHNSTLITSKQVAASATECVYIYSNLLYTIVHLLPFTIYYSTFTT